MKVYAFLTCVVAVVLGCHAGRASSGRPSARIAPAGYCNPGQVPGPAPTDTVVWQAGVKLLMPIAGRPPEYPSMQQEAGIGGEVVSRFVLDTAGRIEQGSIEVLRSSHHDFTRATCAYLRTVRFKPLTREGQPLRAAVTNYPVRYEVR